MLMIKKIVKRLLKLIKKKNDFRYSLNDNIAILGDEKNVELYVYKC